ADYAASRMAARPARWRGEGGGARARPRLHPSGGSLAIAMQFLHRLVRRALGLAGEWYYRRYDLKTLGPVLFVGRTQYRGPEMRFEDGTLLRNNDYIGRLHFNSASSAALGEGSLHRVGFRFAKLMRESLRKLAEAAHSDPSLRDIRVFQGVTWIPSHGEVVGFVSTPMPKNWKTRLLAGHFRLLSWVF